MGIIRHWKKQYLLDNIIMYIESAFNLLSELREETEALPTMGALYGFTDVSKPSECWWGKKKKTQQKHHELV